MTPELHPEFIAYWKRKGYNIKYNPDEREWLVFKPLEPYYVIAEYLRLYNKILYHTHVAPYNNLNEEKMLQFIRLQAFL